MRALLRVVARIVVATAVLVVVGTLLPNRDVLGWTMTIGALAAFALFPVYVVTRGRFGRLLRRDDPQLAEQLGLSQKTDWDGARKLAGVEALNSFLKKGSHRNFTREDLRFAAELYLWVTRAGIVLATVAIGSVPAAVAVAVLWGQHAP